jgi:hypothetical protein
MPDALRKNGQPNGTNKMNEKVLTMDGVAEALHTSIAYGG